MRKIRAAVWGILFCAVFHILLVIINYGKEVNGVNAVPLWVFIAAAAAFWGVVLLIVLTAFLIAGHFRRTRQSGKTENDLS